MAKSKMNDNLKKQHATSNSFASSHSSSSTNSFKDAKSYNYKYEKPDPIGRAGAIINIFFSIVYFLLVLIIFIFIVLLLSITSLFNSFIVSLFPNINSTDTSPFISWIFLIIFLVFFILNSILICNIISSTKFLKGKDNKVMAGILCFLTFNLFSGVFILVSEKQRF